jgi:hypothetical protein
MASWTTADLDQCGSYATPHFAHSQLYYVRDVSRAWCERFCARGCSEGATEAEANVWFRLGRLCAERAARAETQLQTWHCAGCTIFPNAAGELRARSGPVARADFFGAAL